MTLILAPSVLVTAFCALFVLEAVTRGTAASDIRDGQLSTLHCRGAEPNLSDREVYNRFFTFDIQRGCGSEVFDAPLVATSPNKNDIQAIGADKYLHVVPSSSDDSTNFYTIEFQQYTPQRCVQHDPDSNLLYSVETTEGCDEWDFRDDGMIALSTNSNLCLSLSVMPAIWDHPIAEQYVDDVCAARTQISPATLDGGAVGIIESLAGNVTANLRYDGCIPTDRHVSIGVNLAACDSQGAAVWEVQPCAEYCSNHTRRPCTLNYVPDSCDPTAAPTDPPTAEDDSDDDDGNSIDILEDLMDLLLYIFRLIFG